MRCKAPGARKIRKYCIRIETGTPTLSKGMKFLNGTYTQYYNRQHHRATAGYDESDACLTTEWILAGFSKFAKEYNSRDECMSQAYLSGHYTLAQVGEHFGVSYATVSRAVKLAEKRGEEMRVSNVRSLTPCPFGHSGGI